jgi:hypothetical protein
MKKRIWRAVPLLVAGMAFSGCGPESPELASPAETTEPVPDCFAERSQTLLTHVLSQPIHSGWRDLDGGNQAAGLMKWHVNPLAARILEGTDRAEAAALFRRGLELCDNTRDAPWSTTRSLWTTLLGQDVLPADFMDLQKELLQRWNYDCSAGTINMRLYLYTAGYLASERWPDFRDAAEPVKTNYAIDFRGKTVRSKPAAEIQEFCRAKIYEIFRLFTVENQVEHAQVYFKCDVEALKMLADFALDPEMRKRATMVMDYFMLNLATDWNQGYQAEPFFRNKYYHVLMQPGGLENTRALGWLYFGSPLQPTLKDLPLLFTRGDYRMPPVFKAIAEDRSGVREKKESHIRGEAVREAVVWKTFFHSPTYSLSSAVCDYDGKKGIKTGVFKEQRMVNLTWMSDQPCSHFYIFQENYAQPYFGRTKPNGFGSGENPYSHRLQHRRTVIGLYDVPPDYEFYRQYTTYVKSGAILAQIEIGDWVFSHGGGVLFGFYSAAPTTWQRATRQAKVPYPVDVRWCDSRQNAWVLETADAGRYRGTVDEQLAAFAADVLENGETDVSGLEAGTPEFSYRTIYGDTLRIVFSGLGESPRGRHFINGSPVDYDGWKMLDSPWAQQEFMSPVVTVNFAGVELEYDFENWTVAGERMAQPVLPQGE